MNVFQRHPSKTQFSIGLILASVEVATHEYTGDITAIILLVSGFYLMGKATLDFFKYKKAKKH